MGELRAGWERLGERDPLWAVLTDPAKRDGRWAPADFLASGDVEVAAVLEHLGRLDLHPAGRALDFGCGAGRLTQALARRFALADGVDIAATMLTAARRLQPPSNAVFHHNDAADLRLFEDDRFDFVYSSIVLQHMPSALALGYILEFVRVTRPGGVIVFQVPDELRPTATTLVDRLRRLRVRLALRSRLTRQPATERETDTSALDAHATPQALVLAALDGTGATVVDIAITNSLDLDFNGRLTFATDPSPHGWLSKQYTVLLPPA